jgi:hypothetical protein
MQIGAAGTAAAVTSMYASPIIRTAKATGTTTTTGTPTPAPAGCTPGYWKNHYDTPGWPSPFTDSQLFSSVFGGITNPDYIYLNGKTLAQALRLGGGGANALARHAVAAILNIAELGAGAYGLTHGQVVTAVVNALNSGSGIESLKNQLDGRNNAGCPLGGKIPYTDWEDRYGDYDWDGKDGGSKGGKK